MAPGGLLRAGLTADRLKEGTKSTSAPTLAPGCGTDATLVAPMSRSNSPPSLSTPALTANQGEATMDQQAQSLVARVRAMRVAQGLSPSIEDPAQIAELAGLLVERRTTLAKRTKR